MEPPEVYDLLQRAVQELLLEEGYLITQGVGERAVAHKLACKLSGEFPGYDVDCEFNRNLADPKATISADLRNLSNMAHNLAATNPQVKLVPDIVVHKRGTNTFNLLAIEMKVGEIRTKRDRDLHRFDIEKLRVYRESPELRYVNTAFAFIAREAQLTFAIDFESSERGSTGRT